MDANPVMSQEMAGRIVEDGLKFVAACSRTPGIGLAPSRIVDEGWHALLLRATRYAQLHENLRGGLRPPLPQAPPNGLRPGDPGPHPPGHRGSGVRRGRRAVGPAVRRGPRFRCRAVSARPGLQIVIIPKPPAGQAVPMAQEWTDSRLRGARGRVVPGQVPDSRAPEGPRPIRGFVNPAEPEA
ncbi:hypothetical protein GCM10010342_77730 [Streptomyces anulatus]|nr:hypothetical protein GCM10010342_77730 [Streptomyces anulatus]